jgi:3-dehydroquinate dehydratase-2
MLGIREPDVYGHQTLDEVEGMCLEHAEKLNVYIDFKHSNHEGVLIDWIQQARGQFDALIINAGAYTHTSIAIHDALKILDIPIIELHISDPKQRDDFRHVSYIEPLSSSVIAGHGTGGYIMAIDACLKLSKTT